MLTMTRVTLIILILTTCVTLATGQNLVSNGSFEIYTTCPPTANSNSPDYVAYSTGWQSSLNSPDYLNACSTPTTVGIPDNIFGTQSAFDGNAYCGIHPYIKGTFYREILTS